MLRELYIKNMAIIDELRLNFGRGFHIFTGETGAGKSILVEAIGLVLGEKARSGLIRDGASESVVEACFDVSEASEVQDLLAGHGLSHPDNPSELVLKRQISNGGNNRVYINHQRASLALLTELSRELIDFSGQHEQFDLLDSGQDIHTLDGFLGDSEFLDSYQAEFSQTQLLSLKVSELEKSLLEREERLEWVGHQLGEISGLKIFSDQDEKEWIARRQVLKAQSQIAEFGELAQKVLSEGDSSILYNLNRLQVFWEGRSAIKDYFKDISSKIDEIRVLTNDLSYDLAQQVAAVYKVSEYSPDEIEQQLYLLERLKRKFGPGIEDIQNRRQELELQKKSLENIDVNLADLKQNLKKSFARLKELAGSLSKQRTQVARQIETWVTQELSELKMAGARFVVEVVGSVDDDLSHYSKNGADRVRFLLSPNPGFGLKPLSQIASGGETSRIFLALKQVLTRYRRYGTLIFDEVDTGISGAVVELTGKKLKSLADRLQVLCITHHAQIASLADTHFHVIKEVRQGKTITRVQVLDAGERIDEVARLMAGIQVTQKTRELAREMIGQTGIAQTIKAKRKPVD